MTERNAPPPIVLPEPMIAFIAEHQLVVTFDVTTIPRELPPFDTKDKRYRRLNLTTENDKGYVVRGKLYSCKVKAPKGFKGALYAHGFGASPRSALFAASYQFSSLISHTDLSSLDSEDLWKIGVNTRSVKAV